MEDFISTVEDERRQERLWTAIEQRRPFRRFKDSLMDYEEELERWYKFSAARTHERALEWLESIGIEPV